ncbi:MAG: hypothetical protein Q8R89_09865, partial [Desulfomicrobium sp.]|nr:hypothetical protein [Desulfomicrobium sp.]
ALPAAFRLSGFRRLDTKATASHRHTHARRTNFFAGYSAEKFLIFPIVRGSFDATLGTAIARLTGLTYVEFARGTAQCSVATSDPARCMPFAPTWILRKEKQDDFHKSTQ